MQIDSDTIANIGLAAVRGAHLGACALLLGVGFFDRFIADCSAFASWKRTYDRLLQIGLAVAVLSEIAWFVLVARSMSGSSFIELVHGSGLSIVWTQTHFGTLWQIRTALMAASAVAVICNSCLTVASRFRSAARDVGLFVNTALVVTLAWSGHGFTGRWSALHGAADVIHLLIAAVWPIGLVPFFFYLRLWRSSGDPNCHVALASATRRFSTASLIAVFILAGSGIVNAVCLIGRVQDVITTNYGRILLLKVLLFTAMLGIGALNRFALKPRMTDRHSDDTEHATRRLQRNVAIESCIGLAVFFVTGVLGMMSPS